MSNRERLDGSAEPLDGDDGSQDEDDEDAAHGENEDEDNGLWTTRGSGAGRCVVVILLFPWLPSGGKVERLTGGQQDHLHLRAERQQIRTDFNL